MTGWDRGLPWPDPRYDTFLEGVEVIPGDLFANGPTEWSQLICSSLHCAGTPIHRLAGSDGVFGSRMSARHYILTRRVVIVAA